MSDMTLVIGSKSKSSWSLRPWLFLKHHAVPFKELVIDLDVGDSKAKILEHSPSGRVPVLKHGKRRVWESLAICEYCAETLALPQAWPMDQEARAYARSIAMEMHAGFADLRKEMPFSANRETDVKVLSDAAMADVARVRTIWHEARVRFSRGGEWLFGRFGIADAMFAPVALRFQQYSVALDGPEREYMYNMLMHTAVQEWLDGAGAEGRGEGPLERTAEIRPKQLPPPAYEPDPNTEPIRAVKLPLAAANPPSEPVKIRSVIMPPE
ncbi:MAG TPA: glutathione S-transferase family protein [Solimonas sp.]|nr:glutathione S-transferase family protein [Solimonas sp.]